MNIKWDAEKYTADFSFVHQYGNDVIGLLEKKEGCTVLDLGCGNGALTKALADQGWNAVGLDASKELLSAARNQYPGLSFLEGDAAGFSLDHPADAVFSNAVFHWIAKERQPDMMACVFEALKDGGQFVFEMGGYGNKRLRAADMPTGCRFISPPSENTRRFWKMPAFSWFTGRCLSGPRSSREKMGFWTGF